RGVRHREDGGEPAGCGSPGTGQDRLRRLVPRLAQMRVQVHETGQRHEAVGVDDAGTGAAEPAADLGDDAVSDDDVRTVRAEQARAGDHEGLGHRSLPRSSSRSPASSRYSTAMRTDTPLVT